MNNYRISPQNRFSERAEFYKASRPSYSDEIHEIFDSLHLSDMSIVAGIGAGTGVFSKMLLERGYYVYSIEPNKHMLIELKEELKKYSKSIVINTCAEDTSLSDKSVDLITAAQSFHWFTPYKFKKECNRILKKDGKILITWNVINENTPIMQDIKKCMKSFNNDFHSFNGGIQLEKIHYCIPTAKRLTYNHNLFYDKNKFRKRWLSSSFSPLKNSNEYYSFIQKLDAIFDYYSHNKMVIVENQTLVYIGTLFD